MGINRVILTGNLTRDPELKHSQSGVPILSFGLAVNERRKNSQTGEWEDYANFFDCTMFGSRAESVSGYLSKGSKVGIDGKLRFNSWERDGQKRSRVIVIIQDLEFLSSQKDGSEKKESAGVPGPASHPSPSSDISHVSISDIEFEEVDSVYDDDIPF